MLRYDLVIIGGGASGLSAGIEALKNGIEKVLILERNSDLGGNLNLFIHVGFGREYLKEDVTGPEFASRLINDYKSMGGEFKVDSEVLDLSEDKVITFVNPIDGITDVKCNTVILASGCREKFTGNIVVPLHKYTGIFTLLSAHKLVNLNGYLPGKDVVIVGKSKWSLLVARRLVIEGANVKAVVDNSPNRFMREDEMEIIESFNINIVENSEVIELLGNEKISKVNVQNKDTKHIIEIDCDSLILTVGYYPELDYMKQISFDMDEDGFLETNDYKTSVNGIYACGTLTCGESGISYSYVEGKEAAKVVSEYLKTNNN